jgi:hypothetical protein
MLLADSFVCRIRKDEAHTGCRFGETARWRLPNPVVLFVFMTVSSQRGTSDRVSNRLSEIAHLLKLALNSLRPMQVPALQRLRLAESNCHVVGLPALTPSISNLTILRESFISH